MNLDRSVDDRVAFTRKRLCLGPERDPGIRELLEHYPPPVTWASATLWWTPPAEQVVMSLLATGGPSAGQSEIAWQHKEQRRCML